jgi:hypothetical protein
MRATWGSKKVPRGSGIRNRAAKDAMTLPGSRSSR